MTAEKNCVFQNGDVVYFVDKDRIGYGIYDVHIDEYGYAYVDLLELADHRYIDGIPIQDFKSETEWRKLPKNWGYNSPELFKVEDRTPDWEKERRKQLYIKNPEDIEAGLEEGILVYAKTVFHGVIEAEIDKHLGFRIVKKYPHWTFNYGKPNKECARVYDADLFKTYEEAQERLYQKKEERNRELNMSDEEWSIKEIDKVLMFVDNEYAKKCRNFLLMLPDVWDVEIRRSGGGIQWRWFSQKTKWVDIPR